MGTVWARPGPIHDEIVLPQQFAQAILTFQGGARCEQPPLRVIQGSQTQLRDPDRLDVAPIHNEIFIPQGDAVLVFPRQTNGNVAPIRVLRGPAGKPFGASAVAVDPDHNLLIVVGSRDDGGIQIMIFNRTDEDNANPKAVIGGPKSGLTRLGVPLAVHPPTGIIVVSVREPEGLLASEKSFVGVWSIQDNGDVAPH